MGLMRGRAQQKPGVVEHTAPWNQSLSLSGAVTDVTLDGAELTAETNGQRHIPALSGVLRWREADETQQRTLRVPDRLRPDESSMRLLRTWVDLACQVGSRSTNNVGDIPLMTLSALDDVFKLTPLDELLATSGLALLGRLARRPKSWLRREDEVVPLERVRRISRDAVRHLDRHAHHAWSDGHRVFPGRILSTFVEEQLDIYENRVLVHLMVQLRDRALVRLARITRGLQQAQSLHDGLEQLHRLGQYRRHGQLRKRMKQDNPLVGLIEEAKLAQEQLARQSKNLIANLQTPVGHALSFVNPVRWPLKPTNILDFDPDYGELPKLWKAMEDERRQEAAPNPIRDDPDATYADYCLVLVLHALEEAGFKSASSGTDVGLWVHGQGGRHVSEWKWNTWVAEVEREGPVGDIVVNLRERIEIQRPKSKRKDYHAPGSAAGGGTVVRAPLLGAVLRFRPTFTARDGVAPAPSGDREAVVWLHPVGEHDDPSTTWEQALSRRSTGAIPHAGRQDVSDIVGQTLAMPVAPWEYASIDRVGRVLRRVTLWQIFQAGLLPTECPECGGDGRSVGRDGDLGCRDEQCGLRWGTRTCSCGTVIPKILPKRTRPELIQELMKTAKSAVAKRALLDLMCGRQMLAEPSPHPDAVVGDFLICPGCGDCGQGNCGTAGACVRCV
jgi:hypothetical protein